MLSTLHNDANPLHDVIKARAKTHGLTTPSDDLRVTVTWNTNHTDIDLWVVSPKGEVCKYDHQELSTGGRLLDDLTAGFGPERFAASKAMAGKWQVKLHYYANNGNQLIAETYAQVAVVQHAGTKNQKTSYYNVVLPRVEDVVTVATIEF